MTIPGSETLHRTEGEGAVKGAAGQGAAAPFLAPLAPLELVAARSSGALVGRPIEVAAIEQELAAAATGRLVGVSLEGEPGIGKTRLLVSAVELAESRGFAAIAVTADEELRGPFLLARSIFAAQAARAAAAGTEAEPALERALDAVTGNDERELGGLAPDLKLLRTFDLAALAFRRLSAQRPVALLLDDLQWADEDSVRMLRYLVRTDARSPILLLFALRPSETALVNEAVTLLADMERMGSLRRVTLRRFSQVETTELLRQALAGEVEPTSAARMHAQSEGVPFIVQELAQTYRDAGLLQEIDRIWSLAKNADRLVPSAVRTLIQRRAARLPAETRRLLAEAGVLGRSFSLRDLQAVKASLDHEEPAAAALAEGLSPAVSAGLLRPHAEGAPADYGFTHEQVREFAMAALPSPRRRAIHAAVVDLLTQGGEPHAGSLPLLARHAVAAGDAVRAARFGVAAAHSALQSRAPEEALRLVEAALPLVAAPEDRVQLLITRDEALAMVRRPAERLEGLAELAALVDARGDEALALDVVLRRAAALRTADEEDRAAELAREVRRRAHDRGDGAMELRACLELAQALLRATLGESTAPPVPKDVDLDGAEEALTRAVALAEGSGDERSVAVAVRELGIIAMARVRAWFVDFMRAGRGGELTARLAAGETVEEIVSTLPVASAFGPAMSHYGRALEIFERLEDRAGAMSTLVAMAYATWAPDVHLSFSARRIEEVRRLATRMRSFTRESERAMAEIQMLYGVHVFARAKVVPDLALARGREAYELARVSGERGIEFASAGGVALVHLEMGDVDEADRWLARAAVAAQAAPTPLRARQLEMWRGMARSAAADAPGMREHLERAVRGAAEQGRPAARCEVLARLALEASRLGSASRDADLLDLGERASLEAKALVAVLPGHPPWGAQADAALARVHLARGSQGAAAAAARDAMAALRVSLHEDVHLEILLPAARALLLTGDEKERTATREDLRIRVATIAQRTLDEEVRVRWFRGTVGRELAELADAGDASAIPLPADRGSAPPPVVADDDRRILRLLVEGRTNREIADELEIDEETLARRLGALFARIGAGSRAEATAFALRTV